MRFLLDTCALSELKKAKPDPRYTNWFREQADESLFLSVLTLGEIHKGIALLPEGQKKQQLLAWQEGTETNFAPRVFSVDREVARLWGERSAALGALGKIVPTVDLLIACTAIHHRMTVITRNERHFVEAGARVLNPWASVTR